MSARRYERSMPGMSRETSRLLLKQNPVYWAWQRAVREEPFILDLLEHKCELHGISKRNVMQAWCTMLLRHFPESSVVPEGEPEGEPEGVPEGSQRENIADRYFPQRDN